MNWKDLKKLYRNRTRYFATYFGNIWGTENRVTAHMMYNES